MLYMEKAKEKWCAALAVFVCGFLAHGYFFTNKISYHDDSCYYFGVGMTFGSGRWALGLIQKVMNKVGFLNYSSSWWNGGLCILLTDQTEIIRSFIGGIAYCFSCYGVSFCIYVHSTLLYVCYIAYDSGCLYNSQISVWIFAGDRDNCIFHGNLSNLFWSCNITFGADFIKRYGRQEFCTKCHGGIQIFVYASRRNVVILPVQQGMY